jgi:3-oxoacyl-[acyl-carrier-protein] synthase-3
MCAAAARQALGRANLDPAKLDLILCATTTPDHLLPATACLVHREIGAGNAGAFDINAACTGFLSAFITGTQLIRSGAFDRILVVAGETLSRYLNWKDRNTCVLFGDGAGAIVLEKSKRRCGLLHFAMGSLGDRDGLLRIKSVGDNHAPESERQVITMNGNEVYRHAVRTMTNHARDLATTAGVALCDFRAVIAHQANERILRSVQEALKLPWDRFVVNVSRYGNTGSASMAIALSECLSRASYQEGDKILMTVFGGGFTWASAIYQHLAVGSQQAMAESPKLANVSGRRDAQKRAAGLIAAAHE